MISVSETGVTGHFLRKPLKISRQYSFSAAFPFCFASIKAALHASSHTFCSGVVQVGQVIIREIKVGDMPE